MMPQLPRPVSGWAGISHLLCDREKIWDFRNHSGLHPLQGACLGGQDTKRQHQNLPRAFGGNIIVNAYGV